MNPFWSYFECKEAIAAPENVARIDLPMTKAFKRCKWLPLPSAFAARMRRFVAADKKLQDEPKYNDLARLAMCELQGIKLDLIDLAQRNIWESMLAKCPITTKRLRKGMPRSAEHGITVESCHYHINTETSRIGNILHGRNDETVPIARQLQNLRR